LSGDALQKKILGGDDKRAKKKRKKKEKKRRGAFSGPEPQAAAAGFTPPFFSFFAFSSFTKLRDRPRDLRERTQGLLRGGGHRHRCTNWPRAPNGN